MTEEEQIRAIRSLTRDETIELYTDIVSRGDADEIRWMARNDRYFLLGVLMERPDVLGVAKPGTSEERNEAIRRKAQWCFERCREVENDPEGWLDLWSRFHYKSTIITEAGSVQEILKDPNVTIGVLSYNKPTANKFVGQIMRDLERKTLVAYFPDILYDKPPRQNWSTQTGLIVKRTSNPKEPTLQGSGLVDGQPIGAHYSLRIYDDVVVPASVTTPEQIMKTTEAWELSLALGTDDGGREWYAGTRYHPDDTYSAMLKRGALKERRRLCVDADGHATMMMDNALEKLRSRMGSATYGAQMMQNPVSDGVRAFSEHDLMYYDEPPRRSTMNVYTFIDSAKAKKEHSDYTTMLTVGFGWDNNYYLLDMINDRMSLTERTNYLFRTHRQWNPNDVFWEQVGMACDVEHVQEQMGPRYQNYRFALQELPRSGPGSNKQDRIMSLQPVLEQHRWWVPRVMKKMCSDGNVRDMIERLVEQLKNYPVVNHDDILDPMADVNDKFVRERTHWPKPKDRIEDAETETSNTGWDPLG